MENALSPQGLIAFEETDLVRVFPVCYFDKHFVNSSPENQHSLCQFENRK